ncbi:hypothetical protein [Anaerospora hongkongensis]|uniref:hypothetical protein n=1 Tax=Anaerospora hongkongensis TaxID=244830 RepID=UPI002FDB52BD
MIIETFIWNYKGECEKGTEFANRVIQFESSKKQIQKIAMTPQVQWKFQLAGLNEDRLELEAFFDRHYGSADAFYWTDPDGVQQTVRFAQNKLPITLIRELHDPIGYKAEIILEKVV